MALKDGVWTLVAACKDNNKAAIKALKSLKGTLRTELGAASTSAAEDAAIAKYENIRLQLREQLSNSYQILGQQIAELVKTDVENEV